MEIKRTLDGDITISFSSSIDKFGLQQVIDYLKYLEATATSKVKQKDIDKLADQINSKWWDANKSKFDYLPRTSKN